MLESPVIFMSQGADFHPNRKSYAHFDRPLALNDARRLISDPDAIARHAFWPLIVNPQKVIRRKREQQSRVWHSKTRPICYAAHSDSLIYEYYAQQLRVRLEDIYTQLPSVNQAVLAYRQLEGNPSNVHFAKAAFDEMDAMGECEILAIDIEGFFDHLDHDHLKAAWCNLLNTHTLPHDHWAVFKAMTRSYAVTLPQIRDAFKGKARRRLGVDLGCICSPQEFRTEVKPLLKPLPQVIAGLNQSPAALSGQGIPQGLALSVVLANAYMLSLDQRLVQELAELGVSYRRYSDDIMLICPPGLAPVAERMVEQALRAKGLNLSQHKTQRFAFSRPFTGEEPPSCLRCDALWNPQHAQAVSYLGLSYDGRNIRIRDATIARFMKRAVGAIERAYFSASARQDLHLKKRNLYTRLTQIGHGQAYWRDQDGNPPKDAPRLGFFKYVRLAQKVTGSAAVSKQAAQIETHVHKVIAQHEARLHQASGK